MLKGTHHTEEAKRRVSESKKGKHAGGRHKGCKGNKCVRHLNRVETQKVLELSRMNLSSKEIAKIISEEFNFSATAHQVGCIIAGYKPEERIKRSKRMKIWVNNHPEHCASAGRKNKGKPRPWMQGVNHPWYKQDRKGPKNPMFGKHHSEEAIKKIKAARRLQPRIERQLSDSEKKEILNLYKTLDYRTISEIMSKKLNIRVSKRQVTSIITSNTKTKYWFKKYLLNHPEKHPNVVCRNHKKLRKSTEEPIKKLLESKLGFIFNKDFIHNYPIKCVGHIFYADFAFPKRNVDIECDEPYWHNKENDKKRDKLIRESGWKVIRFSTSDIQTNINTIENQLQLLLGGK